MLVAFVPGQVDVVKWLVSTGADKTRRKGMTLWMWAVESGDDGVCEALEKGNVAGGRTPCVFRG